MKRRPAAPGEEPVSKSELKRLAGAQFELGRRLVGLSAGQLRALPLPDNVRDAVAEARATQAKVAHKRQLQFLAKQLRAIDTEPIEEGLAALQAEHRAEIGRQHRVEHWRDALLAEGDPALGRLMAHNPRIERQQLRSLMRQAAAEAQSDQAPRAARELYRALREIDLASGLPEPS